MNKNTHPGSPQKLLQALVNQFRFSIREIAQELQVTTQTIYRIQNGNKPSTAVEMRLFQLYLKCRANPAKSGTGKRKSFFLGPDYPGVRFTLREMDCMRLFVQGKSNSETGKALKLSRRTVEYYANNMKKKLECHTKPELIEKAVNSGFLKDD